MSFVACFLLVICCFKFWHHVIIHILNEQVKYGKLNPSKIMTFLHWSAKCLPKQVPVLSLENILFIALVLWKTLWQRRYSAFHLFWQFQQNVKLGQLVLHNCRLKTSIILAETFWLTLEYVHWSDYKNS